MQSEQQAVARKTTGATSRDHIETRIIQHTDQRSGRPSVGKILKI
jgi:hypothetical protein